MPVKEPIQHHDAVIANAGTVSTVVKLKGAEVLGIYTPTPLTGTALTFQACDTLGGTYSPVYKEDGTAYTVTVAAGRFTKLDASVFRGVQYLKVVSGSAEAAQRTLKVAARDMPG